jgi:hypothetical protein
MELVLASLLDSTFFAGDDDEVVVEQLKQTL